MTRHPDIDWKVATFGVANTSLGRGRGPIQKTGVSTAEQEERMNNAQGWQHNNSSFHPVRFAIEGARQFSSDAGLRDPHEHEFRHVMQTPDRVRAIGRHYDSLPEHDPKALTHFHAMRDEVNKQHDFATNKMGIHFQTVDHDPYENVHDMVHDVQTNKRLKVMGTHVTGKHPVFSDEENDKFRGVHDLFGHAATGRDFSRHGEEAAFQAHSRMFSQHARPAMAAETRGQNASLILNGHFGPQKVGILPPHMHDEHSIDRGPFRQATRMNGLTPPDLSGMPARQAMLVDLAWRKTAVQKFAHDSGDGETIFHCFAGETRYWTRDGIKTLAETVGTTQQVLSNTGNGGNWVDAEIHDFGEQPLMRVTLRRNQRTKVVYATPEHRWLVRTRTDPTRQEARTVLTRDLCSGYRLSWLTPRSLIGASTPSAFGIAHGVVYGDGTRVAGRGSEVRLWGEKDAQLLRYFGESRIEPVKTPNGVDGLRVLDLPGYFKDRPPLDESTSYLYGWLAGYFAADGTVNSQGQVIMSSTDQAGLEFFQLVAMRLGIASYDIVTKEREGFGEMRELHSLQLVGSTLRPEFFLTRTHRQRYDAMLSRDNPERIGWTVVSVEETERMESVYCAVVPEHENFVLDGLINTMNCPFCGSGQVLASSDGTVACDFCHTSFTVQVQPQMPAFPQTVNGMPIDVPGMPGGGDNAMVPPGSPAAQQAGGGAGAPPGVDPASGEAQPGEEGDPSADDGAEGDDSGGPPAFLKSSYRTARGATVTRIDMMRHLAIAHAADRRAMAAQVLAERQRR